MTYPAAAMNHRGPRLLLLVLAAGCGVTVDYVPLNKPPRPMQPRPARSVDVYNTKRPDRPHVEVGMIEAQQDSIYSSSPPAEILGEMRATAGRLGCDGLVITGSNDAVAASGNGMGAADGWSTTLKGYRGVCIVYKPEAPVPAPAAALVPASASPGCDPPCSPGYGCQAGACLALCNPPCSTGTTCGADRVCRRP